MNKEDIIMIMFEFCEQQWESFIHEVKQHIPDITDEEIEKAFNDAKK